MKVRRFLSISAILLATVVWSTIWMGGNRSQTFGQERKEASPIPPNATHCDQSIPIRIDLTPLDQLMVGRTARFQVDVESEIDPDLVERMWIEYEVPQRVIRAQGFSERAEVSRRTRRSRFEFGIAVPDRRRYQIRARFMVQLLDGSKISQTATRYLDLGNNPPDGMIGRHVDADGTGIRIYQGQTVSD